MAKGESGFSINENFSEKDLKTIDKPDIKTELFEWFEIFAGVLVTVVLIFTFIFNVATIEGKSMRDTLYADERIIISGLFYEPQYGDIVVISRNAANNFSEAMTMSNKPIIKRVIATEGQTVGIDFENGIVYVDGKPLTESYTKTPTNLKYDIDYSVESPVTVPKNHVFVLGDNRNDSLDSRSSQIGENGMIDVRYIMGHALLRIYPFSEIGVVR